MTRIANEQPAAVCHACGEKYGSWFVNGRGGRPTIATWHYGHCDVCKRDGLPVTEARDFGYLVEWQPRLLQE